MPFAPVTDDQMRVAQILSGATMALWLAVGFVPGVRRHAQKIRAVALAAYLLGGAVFMTYVLTR
jgi:hypothetical protein